jgi:hypothetical protein
MSFLSSLEQLTFLPRFCLISKKTGQMVQSAGSVSVRATILALGRFGIAPEAEVKLLEKRWKKYRESTGCDRHGKHHP